MRCDGYRGATIRFHLSVLPPILPLDFGSDGSSTNWLKISNKYVDTIGSEGYCSQPLAMTRDEEKGFEFIHTGLECPPT
jgi:hypothetical protein